MTEYWDLLDENREPLGMLHRRGDALPAGARHLCVEIITVFNGRILTTLRHPQKHNGGYWEVTTGSALAGEDSRTAAVRELYEETGIRAEKEELILFDHVITPRIFSDTYLLRLAEEPKPSLFLSAFPRRPMPSSSSSSLKSSPSKGASSCFRRSIIFS